MKNSLRISIYLNLNKFQCYQKYYKFQSFNLFKRSVKNSFNHLNNNRLIKEDLI